MSTYFSKKTVTENSNIGTGVFRAAGREAGVQALALSIKLIYCLKHKTGLTREQFQDYWLNTRGPIVESVKHLTGT